MRPDYSDYAPSYAPSSQQMLRKRTVRVIPLTPQGNLVIDVPVADRVSKMGKYSVEDEFTHMRYTAVTCSPDDFPAKGYVLRQQELRRITEVFIVVTMYNEDDYLFCKSMQSLMKGIAYLTNRSRSETWGKEGWKKAIICIVADGRSKINSRTLDVLGLMGVYQHGIMKDHVNRKPVTAHLFEYTTQVCVTQDLRVHGHDKGYCPVQIMFCLKEKNAKKINSHRWFFNAFAPLIRPNVCVLIDVGTKPSLTSLYHLWKAFDKSPSLGGACGEIYAELGPSCCNLLNPLVAAQNFEYKMSNILDKPLESIMGYISVLPGAFSAYRYRALLGRPLEQYFLGESLHGSGDIFASNMYLAEDRILCFEIVTKVKSNWVLKYIKKAKAETDVPDSTPEFISQRRRWLNGSFFASVHALTHWFYIFRSGHNIVRQFILLLQFMYNFINLFFTWFGTSFFYLTFFYLVGTIKDEEQDPFILNGKKYGGILFDIVNMLYVLVMVLVLVSSLGNRPQGSKFIYNSAIFLFMLIMIFMLFITGYSIALTLSSITSTQLKNFPQLVRTNANFRDIILSTVATYGLYLTSSIIHLDPWHMFTSIVQYFILLPSFQNILQVYAFCNLHDVSWGTKGDNDAKALGGVTTTLVNGKDQVEVEMLTDIREINTNYEKFIKSLSKPRPVEDKTPDDDTKMQDYFRSFRTRVVLTWLFSNAMVVIVMTNEELVKLIRQPFLISTLPNGDPPPGNPFLQFIFYSVLILSTIRFIGSTLYLIL